MFGTLIKEGNIVRKIREISIKSGRSGGTRIDRSVHVIKETLSPKLRIAEGSDGVKRSELLIRFSGNTPITRNPFIRSDGIPLIIEKKWLM